MKSLQQTSSVGRALLSKQPVLRVAHKVPATRPGRFFFPVVSRLKTERDVALTFDDGPGPELDMFLSVLEKAKARATFFVVGEQVEHDPSRLQDIISYGHDVGVHCYRHRDHLLLSPDLVVEDMRRAKKVIEGAAECSTKLFRPPYGRFSLASWLEADRQGWERVLWSRDAKDWAFQATPQSIADKVGWPEPGDILLLHNSDRYAHPGCYHNTLKALPIILDRLHSRGLRARSISEML